VVTFEQDNFAFIKGAIMKSETAITGSKTDIVVRQLQEDDLEAADRIMRLAFGTFIGLPDPTQFMGDADYVRTRWRANPDNAFAAEADGRLVGSNFVTHWGSVAFFGPLTIHPEFWDRGVGKRLMEPVIKRFTEWGVTHAGLFTFPHSLKHVGLYQKFGFWPRFLTMLMAKEVEAKSSKASWTTFSELQSNERERQLRAAGVLTDTIYSGLDVSDEVEAVAKQNLGDTLLLWDGDALVGLAVCHCGPGTEAGSAACYIKFGAVESGAKAKQYFTYLLDACEDFAASRKLSRIVAGVNTARHEAYQQMRAHGFLTNLQGVVMSRPNEPGYNRSEVYLIDDWR
jgi:GNAT superfamily N-acetyltransferase